MPRSSGDDASTADSGAWLAVRQMGTMLRKNALLKRADWRQTTAEVGAVVVVVAAVVVVVVGGGGDDVAVVVWRIRVYSNHCVEINSFCWLCYLAAAASAAIILRAAPLLCSIIAPRGCTRFQLALELYSICY